MPRTPLSRPAGLEPGAVAIPGMIRWISRIQGIPATRNRDVWVGKVEASPELFGEPLNPSDPRVANETAFTVDSLQFLFWSFSELYAGQAVTFDIAAGNYGSHACNIQSADTDEDVVRSAIRLCEFHQLPEFAARLRAILETL